MAKRLKANELQTMTDANNAMSELRDLSLSLEAAEGEMNKWVAGIKEAYEQQHGPKKLRSREIVLQLKSWATANKSTLLIGEKKSIQLNAGTIGWRTSPPKVTLDGVEELALIEDILNNERDDLLVFETRLNRAAILQMPSCIDGFDGVKITQSETFFAEPMKVDLLAAQI